MAKVGKLRGWRKIAAATWGHADDPQIYGDLEVEATALLRFIEQARAAGVKLTMTHLVGRAIAHAYRDNPDLNARLRRGRLIPRDSIDIFFIVSTAAGSELSGVKVEQADEKAAVEIAEELAARANRIHSGDDADLGRTKAMLDKMPLWLLKIMMRFAAWIAIDLDKHLPQAGMPRQTFGSALVTSVGMFGVQKAYAPLSPFYRVPYLVLVGEVADKAVVRDGQVVARPMLTLTGTMDHRYLDGFHAARLARSIMAYCADPFAFEPALPAAVSG